MMKLYYLPGACSLASHICLIEAGIPHQAIAVDRQKRTAEGGNFLDITPKGYVPALVLDDGQVLTESAALLPYIGTLNPTARLIPQPGSLAHFRVTEWCAYINSEVHRNYSPLFRPTTTDEQKAAAREAVLQRFAYVETQLGEHPYLTGDDFTVADAYLYVTLSWADRVGLDLSALPRVSALLQRCAARPAVIAARAEESRSA